MLLKSWGLMGFWTHSKLAKPINKLQNGFVYYFAFVMLIGLTIFSTIVCLWDLSYFWAMIDYSLVI